MQNPRVSVVGHPAVQDRLARLRDEATPTPVFRHLVEEIGLFLAYEATRGLALYASTVQTPVAAADVLRIAPRPVVAPILRAGLGLLPGFLDVIDDASIAHLGFYRDPDTLAAVPYYANLPEDLAQRDVFVVDPMLATGHSGTAALTMLADRGARNITFVCIIAAPAGIATLHSAHPTVRIVTAAVDAALTDHGYIIPGLGDAGDRMFGSSSSVPVSVAAR